MANLDELIAKLQSDDKPRRPLISATRRAISSI